METTTSSREAMLLIGTCEKEWPEAGVSTNLRKCCFMFSYSVPLDFVLQEPPAWGMGAFADCFSAVYLH